VMRGGESDERWTSLTGGEQRAGGLDRVTRGGKEREKTVARTVEGWSCGPGTNSVSLPCLYFADKFVFTNMLSYSS